MNDREFALEQLEARELAKISTGKPAKIHSDECVAFRSTHPSCKDCSSLQACNVYVGLRLAVLGKNSLRTILEVLGKGSTRGINFEPPDPEGT